MVIGFLRYVGTVNAAVWFGAAIFFTFVAGPGIFSEEMHSVLGADQTTFIFYAGGVAMVLIKRYFGLQYFCAVVAFFQLFAERLYLGKKVSRFTLGLLMGIVLLVLLGGFWVQPKLRGLRETMYHGPTQTQKDQARHTFNVWHGTSMALNFLVVAGLCVYLVRVNRPPEAGRYGTVYQIP
jgi:hypothetical protein